LLEECCAQLTRGEVPVYPPLELARRAGFVEVPGSHMCVRPRAGCHSASLRGTLCAAVSMHPPGLVIEG
jgi:hypothetical protein